MASAAQICRNSYERQAMGSQTSPHGRECGYKDHDKCTHTLTEHTRACLGPYHVALAVTVPHSDHESDGHYKRRHRDHTSKEPEAMRSSCWSVAAATTDDKRTERHGPQGPPTAADTAHSPWGHFLGASLAKCHVSAPGSSWQLLVSGLMSRCTGREQRKEKEGVHQRWEEL